MSAVVTRQFITVYKKKALMTWWKLAQWAVNYEPFSHWQKEILPSVTVLPVMAGGLRGGRNDMPTAREQRRRSSGPPLVHRNIAPCLVTILGNVSFLR